MLQRLIIPLVALVLAGATAYFARNWIEEKKEQQPVAVAAPAPEITYQKVLVAANDVRIGSFVNVESFVWQEWPDVDLPETYFVQGQRKKDELLGAVARKPIGAGDPITDGSLVSPGDRGFLAVVLGSDMRALTVPVDEASSNAGLIFPGDRVDIILTQSVKIKTGDANEITRRVSETILQDVRVIAMGKRLNPANTGTVEAPGKGNNQVRTATLELTPKGAEMVALVSELGKLSLSLRSLADESGEEARVFGSVPTWDSDVSKVLQDDRSTGSTLVVVRGGDRQAVDVPASSSQ